MCNRSGPKASRTTVGGFNSEIHRVYCWEPTTGYRERVTVQMDRIQGSRTDGPVLSGFQYARQGGLNRLLGCNLRDETNIVVQGRLATLRLEI